MQYNRNDHEDEGRSPSPANAFNYIDTAVGGAHNRNNVVSLEEYTPNGHPDCFSTYLRYPESFRAWVSQTGSVRGYTGEAKADHLPLDFDSEGNPVRALEDARRFVRQVEARYDVPPDALRLFFSGNKGFSIEVPAELFGGFAPSRCIAAQLKALAVALAGELETFDASIYDTTRLWRTPNTRHGKSGLCKIPLASSELLGSDIAEIKALARQPRREFAHSDPSEYGASEALMELRERVEREGPKNQRDDHQRLDTAAILKGVSKGQRDDMIHKLSSKLRGADVPYDWAKRLVLEAAANCEPPFPELEALRKVQRAYEHYPPGNAKEAFEDSEILSDHIGWEFGQKEFEEEDDSELLPGKTPAEIIEEAQKKREFFVEGVLAPGDITDLSGTAKDSGKTTFITHMLNAMNTGEDFIGLPTKPAKALYLTEQGNNIANALEQSGLADAGDNVTIVQYRDVFRLKWPELIRRAVHMCLKIGAQVLVVDTFAVFSDLKGTEENNVGDIQARVKPLQVAAQKHGLAIMWARHAGKDGRGRGSSMFEGSADIVLTLGKPEGNQKDTVRELSGKGRHDEIPKKLVIELTGDGYKSLGTDEKVEFRRAVRTIRAVTPYTPDEAKPEAAILDYAKGEDEEVSRSTARRALLWLEKKGGIKREGAGKKGDPYRYWQPYEDPPPDGNGDDEFLSDQTPTPNGQKENTEPFAPPNGGAEEESQPSLKPDAPAQEQELTIEAALEEFGHNPASQKMLNRYLKTFDEETFEFLAKTVVYTLGKLPDPKQEPDAWRSYAPTVEAAVEEWKRRNP